MKVADTLTEAAFADRLDEVLDRASNGEEFAIERDGEVFAIVGPSSMRPNVAGVKFVAKDRDFPRPDGRFADDQEAVRATQAVPELPE